MYRYSGISISMEYIYIYYINKYIYLYIYIYIYKYMYKLYVWSTAPGPPWHLPSHPNAAQHKVTPPRQREACEARAPGAQGGEKQRGSWPHGRILKCDRKMCV